MRDAHVGTREKLLKMKEIKNFLVLSRELLEIKILLLCCNICAYFVRCFQENIYKLQ